MSVDKYKFVSPGVFVKEIDKSEIPKTAATIGPVIIGRTQKGPAFRPTMVSSMDEFVQIFGEPIPGGRGGDVWREGNYTSPTYAGFAARAYLKNNGPVTIVRVLGIESDEAVATTAGLGAAGWTTAAHGGAYTDGGAYGLFMVNSGTLRAGASGVALGDAPAQTGTLAAIWYTDGCKLALSGVLRGTAQATASNTALLESTSQREFKVVVETTEGEANALGTHETFLFNFDRDSDKYIRKVFNTNPTKTNAEITTTPDKYWLGETFENKVLTACSDGTQYGIILPLKDGSNQGGDHLAQATPAETGYFISQDLQNRGGIAFDASQQPSLFKFVGLSSEGQQLQEKVKISVTGLKAPVDSDTNPYGSFAIEIRDINDTDARKNVLERFDNLNLNPNSTNYIAAVIGDRYIAWSSTENRYKEYNDYSNNSNYVRVEVHSNVADGNLSAEALPFGVQGPLRFNSFHISGSSIAGDPGDPRIVTGTLTGPGGSDDASDIPASFVVSSSIARASLWGPAANADYPHDEGIAIGLAGSHDDHFDCQYDFPDIPLRSSTRTPESFSDHKKAYFGVDLLRSGSTGTSKRSIDSSVKDIIRRMPGSISSFNQGVNTHHMWTFTLDDIVGDLDAALPAGNLHVGYTSGSHEAGTSYSALSGGYQSLLNAGINKFTTVMHGGFDGLDITERDPFRNTLLDGKTATTNYAYASLKRAIEIVSDPDEMDFNLAVMPGITNEEITQDLVDVCEDRGDALAIIDPKGGYEPSHEGLPASYPSIGSVATTVTNMKARELNSSYACAYYPWVQSKDGTTGQLIWLPPSVVALGTMGSSANDSELWFAPAGFNRGGLSEGSAGLAVLSAREKLTSDQRDDLYENRINPIASFPSEGLVIFGQKTTQIKSSALDRINVRRLMIFLKKEISRIANGILFDQNVQTTWDRFTSKANPLLASVKTRFGLEDYKLVLDETTTTPDLRDRNIMYAKVLLKPAKAIEFIALDFTVMRSGAAFED